MSRLLSPWRTLIVAVLTAIVATVGLLVPATEAAFTASTGDTGNTLATATLTPPTGFTAQCISSSRVDLSWTPSTSAVTGYRIERQRDNEATFAYLATVGGQAASSYSDTNSPFPSSLLSILGTITVTYRIRAEISGTSWQSPATTASASGTVAFLLFFSCN